MADGHAKEIDESRGLVFVLGAGFTRAFVPQSPLLVDDYGVRDLRKRFDSFSHAVEILDDALLDSSNDKVDLERLMTRVQYQDRSYRPAWAK